MLSVLDFFLSYIFWSRHSQIEVWFLSNLVLRIWNRFYKVQFWCCGIVRIEFFSYITNLNDYFRVQYWGARMESVRNYLHLTHPMLQSRRIPYADWQTFKTMASMIVYAIDTIIKFQILIRSRIYKLTNYSSKFHLCENKL